jgi:hypothetical protein
LYDKNTQARGATSAPNTMLINKIPACCTLKLILINVYFVLSMQGKQSMKMIPFLKGLSNEFQPVLKNRKEDIHHIHKWMAHQKHLPTISGNLLKIALVENIIVISKNTAIFLIAHFHH